ncbi:MAG: hypothetical protein MUE52_09695 [Tabrizicola sp.]|jgi:hypothetical protein|nr:hypothetical protein [Tabrizicola sp.]
MRLALLLVFLPLPAFAGANPEALYKLMTGTWAATPETCATDETWTFAEGSLIIHGDGGEACGFARPGTDGGIDVVLDVLCPIPGETMQASARRIGLDLQGVSPGLRDPGDRLTVTDRDQTLNLIRCD